MGFHPEKAPKIWIQASKARISPLKIGISPLKIWISYDLTATILLFFPWDVDWAGFILYA
jgi:hypothetical protein